MANKKAYFQGGGGVNEPTPGKKKYKSDPAIVVQPRFKEPFYRNYDLYKVPGMEDVGPGVGWHDMQQYDSVQEFLEARRNRMKGRYVADDSWQLDSGQRTKTKPKMAMRMAIFEKMIKQAGDENDGPNFDYGHGAYDAMNQGKKMKTITDFKYDGPTAFAPVDHKNKKTRLDYNKIDFPLDDQIKADPIVPEEGEYQVRNQMGDLYELPDGGSDLDPQANNISLTSPQIAGEHSYLPSPDFQGRSDDALNFGRDYDDQEEPGTLSDEDLDKLKNKYLTPKETSLFGLPDGISPPDDLDPEATVSDENPDYGTTNSGNTLYEGM